MCNWFDNRKLLALRCVVRVDTHLQFAFWNALESCNYVIIIVVLLVHILLVVATIQMRILKQKGMSLRRGCSVYAYFSLTYLMVH